MSPINTRRLIWRRSRSWPVTAAVALVAGGLAAGAVSRAQQDADAVGPRRTVAVAVGDLAPGHEVADRDVRWEERPATIGPDVAGEPVGRVVTSPIFAGEAIAEARLARPGAGGPLALGPAGSRAVALPVNEATPPLEPGDEVDLLAPSRTEGRQSHGRWVALGAVVVQVDDDVVVVAVEPDDAAPTAAAALEGPVATVLVSSR